MKSGLGRDPAIGGRSLDRHLDRTMRYVERCVAAFAIIVHFWQISPALSCTFIRIPPPTVFHGLAHYYKGVGFERCLSICFNKTQCDHIVYNKADSFCSLFSNTTELVNRTIAEEMPNAVRYRFDRNLNNTKCPTVKQWIAHGKTN